MKYLILFIISIFLSCANNEDITKNSNMNPPAGAVINEDNKTICLYGVLYWYWNEKTMRVIGSMNKEVHITGYLAPVYQRDTIPKLTLCN